MSKPTDDQKSGGLPPILKDRRGIIGIAVVAVLMIGYMLMPGEASDNRGTTFEVRRGTLPITVLDGGTIEALESQVIKSEVRGETKILSIVEEGYLVTPQDIEQEKILVTLDDSNLRDNLTQAEIDYQNAVAQYTDAKEQLEIQLKQNESDIRAAELTIKFARMDFERYLGSALASRIVTDLGLDKAEQAILEEAGEALTVRALDDLPMPAATNTAQPAILTMEMAEKLAAAMKESRGFDVTAEMIIERAEKDDEGRPIASGRMRGRLEEMGIKFDTPAPPQLAEHEFDRGEGRGSGRGPRRGPGGEDGGRGLGSEADPRSQEGAPEVAAAPTVEPDLAQDSEDPGVSVSLELGSDVDFAGYLDTETLQEGEAKQSLRQLMDQELLSAEELSLAQNQLDGTERLATKDFVTQTELETDRMKVRRSEINQDAATTALDLFIKYEFPKQSELLLSDYEEALRNMERTQKLAVSKLAQAHAKLRSAEAQYELKRQRRDELLEQIDNTQIVAERQGMVVYGGDSGRRYSRDEQIQEGTTVRERQEIITIPDMTRMGAKVNIHESSIKLVKVGQRALVRVDAYPEERIDGQVVKVDVLPDSQNRWLNPDLKVYGTTIAIDGIHEWLKPEMNAEIEILVDVLEDIVYVPVQAVMTSKGEKVCFVQKGSGVERRVVETGKFNNEFIEIVGGLEEGEDVFLRRPDEFRFEEEDVVPAGNTIVEDAGDVAGEWGRADRS